MNLSGLLPLLHQVPAYRQLVKTIEAELLDRTADARPAHPLGVITAARPYLLAALYRHFQRPFLLLTARAERVNHWIDQLRIWTGSASILSFPEPDGLPYERVPWARETVSDRLASLTAFVTWKGASGSKEPPLVVASARALMHKTLPVREFRLGLREYEQGQEIDLHRTLNLWVAHGYRPEPLVEEPGAFSRRGGLVDVFPPNLPQPVRLDLFGDEIDTIRVFDATTQRSREHIDRFILAPATEALPRLAPYNK